MRQRWSIVLVDEFQDTDPVQWEVLDRAFTGHATMVLIGDPKQAIYNFRGGDVTTYLQAARTAATKQTLSVNWRSDAALVTAFDRLLGGAALGDDRIVVRPVEAHHGDGRLVGAPQGAPFRVRVRSPSGPRQAHPGSSPSSRSGRGSRRTSPSTSGGCSRRGRPTTACRSGRVTSRSSPTGTPTSPTPARRCSEVGVPAVIAGGGSVFSTPAAVEWLTLVEALEQPHRSVRVRSAALTCFFGHSAAEIDAGGDDLTDDVAEVLRSWVELFAVRGMAAVLEAATERGLPARVLAEVGGDRRLTDLRHIGEALHEVTLTERQGLASLLTWLREQVAEGRAGRGLERTRRLDSDAAAVQLVTIHASKGLEYPVVYLPALADRYVGDPVRPRFHDAEERRCLNVGGGGADWSEHCRRWADEEAGEWLRLLYVALTRAKSQVVCWWAPTKNAIHSPLHRLLMRPQDDPTVPLAPGLPSDDEAVTLFAEWRDRGGPAPGARQSPPTPEPTPRSRRRRTSTCAGSPARSTPPGSAAPTPR